MLAIAVTTVTIATIILVIVDTTRVAATARAIAHIKVSMRRFAIIILTILAFQPILPPPLIAFAQMLPLSFTYLLIDEAGAVLNFQNLQLHDQS